MIKERIRSDDALGAGYNSSDSKMTDTTNRWVYGACAVGLLVLSYGLLTLRGMRARRRIVSSRRGGTVESFIREFDGTRLSQPVLEMAYSDLMKVARFPVRRKDDFERTLGLLPEDLEKVLQKRCEGLGLPDLSKSPHASLFPLKTPEDYARFLSATIEGKANSAQHS